MGWGRESRSRQPLAGCHRLARPGYESFASRRCAGGCHEARGPPVAKGVLAVLPSHAVPSFCNGLRRRQPFGQPPPQRTCWQPGTLGSRKRGAMRSVSHIQAPYPAVDRIPESKRNIEVKPCCVRFIARCEGPLIRQMCKQLRVGGACLTGGWPRPPRAPSNSSSIQRMNLLKNGPKNGLREVHSTAAAITKNATRDRT